MRNKGVVVITLVAVLAIASVFVWNYLNRQDYLKEIVHETDRWAVIRDSKGDHIAVESTSDEVWNQLVELYQNKTVRWVGGVVEEYDNKWGFRFKPETITVAEITAEGAQSWIRGISEDLDYWMNLGWVTYVSARVTEIHPCM